MKQFEYKKIEYLFKEMSEEKLNEMGAEGWELCAATQETGIRSYFFKREKES